MSFCRLGDTDHVLKYDPLGLQGLDKTNVVEKKPVLGIALGPRFLVGGGESLTGRPAK
jgi:hypothetical protein